MRMTRSGRKCTARALWALSLALLFVAGICIPAHAADLQAAFGEEDAPAVELDARISHLAAMDLDTGALLLAQDADEPFAPTGGAVTMMTTYLAAQALTPEATVAMDGGEARAADLAAAAILDGDQDSASALAQAIGEDAVSRMNDAALTLGMTATTYVSPAGTPEEGQRTTCTDLLRLGRALVESETFADVFSCTVWETASPDSGLPAQIENRVQMLNPDSEFYDARVLSAFGGGSGAELFNTVVLAQAGEQRVLVACAAAAGENETYALLSQVLDALEAGYFRADVTEQARAALDLAANSADGIALTYIYPEHPSARQRAHGLDSAGKRPAHRAAKRPRGDPRRGGVCGRRRPAGRAGDRPHAPDCAGGRGAAGGDARAGVRRNPGAGLRRTLRRTGGPLPAHDVRPLWLGALDARRRPRRGRRARRPGPDRSENLVTK